MNEMKGRREMRKGERRKGERKKKQAGRQVERWVRSRGVERERGMGDGSKECELIERTREQEGNM